MNVFTFHQKVLKASNKIQPPGQILIKIKLKYTHITKKYFGEKNATESYCLARFTTRQ